MANIVPVRKDTHSKLTVSSKRTLAHVAKQHIVPINAREYAQAATCYPIILVKDPEVNTFRSVVMLGLQANENLYYSEPLWNAVYVPQGLAASPFGIGLDPDKEKTLTTCIDLDNEFVGEDKEEALFDDKGEETPFYKGVQETLSHLYESEIATNQFIKELTDNDLLIELKLELNLANGGSKNLVGLYGLDEKKLQALPDEKVLDFYKRGLFVPIHAMLGSIGQINRLAQLRNLSDSEEKISGIRFSVADAKKEAETA